MNKVGWSAWLLPGLFLRPEVLMDFISRLVVAVLQIIGSKNKSGHKPNWGSPRIFMQIED